jgi:Ca2+-transporting ATPase
MAAGTLGVMDLALPGGLVSAEWAGAQGVRHAQTMGFTTLVLQQLFNAFSARSGERSAFHRLLANRWLWLAAAVSLGLQLAVVHAPFLQRAFRTVPLSPRDWLVCAAVASSVLWVAELRKLAVRVHG